MSPSLCCVPRSPVGLEGSCGVDVEGSCGKSVHSVAGTEGSCGSLLCSDRMTGQYGAGAILTDTNL
jgi:uncharacterized low-complexity protein